MLGKSAGRGPGACRKARRQSIVHWPHTQTSEIRRRIPPRQADKLETHEHHHGEGGQKGAPPSPSEPAPTHSEDAVCIDRRESRGWNAPFLVSPSPPPPPFHSSSMVMMFGDDPEWRLSCPIMRTGSACTRS